MILSCASKQFIIEQLIQDLFNKHIQVIQKHPNASMMTYVTFTPHVGGGKCGMCQLDHCYVWNCQHLREIEVNGTSKYQTVTSMLCLSCEEVLSSYQHSLNLTAVIKRRARLIGHLYTQLQFISGCMICPSNEITQLGYSRSDTNYKICIDCKIISYQCKCATVYMMLRCVLLPEVSMHIAVMMCSVLCKS